ncbi:hypothetical protein [Streptomyces flaveus]|uniref:Uncharacterized protein n=1 Tax=Streptomyces flaveus TaxID=66370 RepID=A0A917VDU6_9ACTN|nr:hypothetical protein [Streptomyces flaveus]GGK68146.1 hypothetical protein GCM10010094_31440 [Streptomyces flaveus]
MSGTGKLGQSRAQCGGFCSRRTSALGRSGAVISAEEQPAKTIEDRKRIAVVKTHNNDAQVKGQYKRTGEGGSVRTKWNKNDYASTTKSGSGARIYSVKACEYKNNWPDDCSSWES